MYMNSLIKETICFKNDCGSLFRNVKLVKFFKEIRLYLLSALNFFFRHKLCCYSIDIFKCFFLDYSMHIVKISTTPMNRRILYGHRWGKILR